MYKVAKNELKRMGIWRDDKEVLLKMYAQSVEDWEMAVDDAKKHGEVSETHNGSEQVNAWHTKKNKYLSQSKGLYERLFHQTELAKVKTKGKEDKGLSDLI